MRFSSTLTSESIPEGPRNLFLTEYNVNVPPTSQSRSQKRQGRSPYFFVQDNSAGLDPTVPSSLFKHRNNDLYLSTISVKYAGQTKPLTSTQSNYSPATLHSRPPIILTSSALPDSYHDSGMDPDVLCCENFSDWLKRKDNNATTCTVSLIFFVPGKSLLNNTSQVYLIAHYSNTALINTQGGNITSVQVAPV